MIRIPTSLANSRARAPRRPAAALIGLLLLAPLAARAIDCEELRTQIDAKIRAGGVQRFSLLVIGNGDTTNGRVVGSCDRGARKIVYTQAGAASAPAPAPRAPILTECKDGSEPKDGRCAE